MKVLIAEDNEGLQRSIGMVMKAWGFDYDLADNGQEAVNQAKTNEGQYDLCIMDVEMPIMNGCEATRIIRRDLNYFPIMACSGNYLYRDECFESGADDFVEKPCSPDELLAKIREMAVKSYKFKFNGNDLLLTKEMPMDQQHAKELIQLKKQGLVKMRLEGPADREIIAHKNTPNKISHDFIIKKQLMTEFLNRDPEKPTLCDLYRGSKDCIVETFMDEKAYTEKLKYEDMEMSQHTEKVFRGEEE